MKTAATIEALNRALDGRRFCIDDRVFTASLDHPGALSMLLGPDCLYLFATPDYDGSTDSLPIEILDDGVIREADEVRVAWTEDTETNVTIWWALVSPYVRKHAPGLRRTRV